MSAEFVAGAAVADISPRDSQFLYGYPHVRRYSTGIHDPLLASALYMSDGSTEVLVVAADIIYVPKDLSRRARRRIAAATGVPESNILLTATHTHSAPTVVDIFSNSNDEAVPPADPAYVALAEDGIAESAVKARSTARPARVGLAVAHTGLSRANRHDPDEGPCDPEIPVLAVREAESDRYIACMLVHCLHPTVLHEDSTLVSADFPGRIRQYLQERVLGPDCPVVYHTGPAGNQSPRHLVTENTFAAAWALGERIGRRIEAVLPDISYRAQAPIHAARAELELVPRDLPSVDSAAATLRTVRERLDRLRAQGAPAKEVRTAECDWFGAEETLFLAQAAAAGRLDAVRATCQPAEIQALRVGPWSFVAWPGEIFIEYGLEIRASNPDTFVISLCNGELQGYIVTPEAVEKGCYEAGNSLFDCRNGEGLVAVSRRLLERLHALASDAATVPSP